MVHGTVLVPYNAMHYAYIFIIIDYIISIAHTHTHTGYQDCIFQSDFDVLSLSVYLTEYEDFNFSRDQNNLVRWINIFFCCKINLVFYTE